MATDCYNYSYIHIAHNENKDNQALVKLNTLVHYIWLNNAAEFHVFINTQIFQT